MRVNKLLHKVLVFSWLLAIAIVFVLSPFRPVYAAPKVISQTFKFSDQDTIQYDAVFTEGDNTNYLTSYFDRKAPPTSGTIHQGYIGYYYYESASDSSNFIYSPIDRPLTGSMFGLPAVFDTSLAKQTSETILTGYFVEIKDPANLAPKPVLLIKKGNIAGRVYKQGDWTSNFADVITGGNVILYYYTNGNWEKLLFKGDTTRGVDSATETYANFNKFTLSDASAGGLLGGKYRLAYYHTEGTDAGGDAKGGLGWNLLGSKADYVGYVDFNLTRINDYDPKRDAYDMRGYGKITLIGATGNELTSTATSTSMKESKDGIFIDVGETPKNSFTEAIKSAVKSMMEFVSGSIAIVQEKINENLTTQNEIEDEKGLKDVWMSIRNSVFALLTLGLLIIAFMNIVPFGGNNFAITTMLPKYISGIILTYFSFFIATFLLDLASAFQQLLIEESFTSSGPISSFNLNFGSAIDGISGIGMTIALAIMGIFALLVMIWLWIVLLIRKFMIFFLVAISPLAFIMMIMPFTEQYYKKWWATFWKWLFIGPGVIFMLWLSLKFLGGIGGGWNGSGESFQSGEAWTWIIFSMISLFLAATLPLKMGGDVYSAVQKHGGKAVGYAGKKTGISGALADRKASVDARSKARGAALRSRIALSGEGANNFLRRGLAGVDKQQAAALRLQTIKGMGDALPEDAAALKSIIESTSGLKQEAAVLKAATSGKLVAEEKDAQGIITGASKTVAIVEQMLKNKTIAELDRTIGKEQGDFYTTAALLKNTFGDEKHPFTGGANSAVSKTNVQEYKKSTWDYQEKKYEAEGKNLWESVAKQKSVVDSILKSKPEVAEHAAKKLVESGHVAHIQDEAQRTEIYAKAGISAPTATNQGSSGYQSTPTTGGQNKATEEFRNKTLGK